MRKVTIKDVARECNVSTQTISRVINNSENVKKSTRDFVMKKIKELGYRPNLYAKNLSWKQNRNILISIRRTEGAAATIWTNSLISEIFSRNRDKNTSIFVEQYFNDEELKYSLLNTSNTFIDGVILFYEKENDERIKILENEEIPFIIVGKSYSGKHVYVSTDDFNTTLKGVEYLFEKGIRKINFITAGPSPLNMERERGVIEAFNRNGIDLKNLIINKDMNTQKNIYGLIRKICSNNELPDAFFVSGDEKAIVVLKALSDCGLKVPEDVSVLGLDNISVSEYLCPALTTIALDYRRIASCIYEKLDNMIEGFKELSEEVSCEIVERESVIRNVINKNYK